MALTTAQYRRGGANGGVSDADGRGFLINTGGVADTLVASISATPVAAATVVALIAPPAGVYAVQVFLSITGTAETLPTNLRLRQNGATVGLVPSVPGVGQSYTFPRVTVTTGNLTVDSAAAATAGALYNVTLCATRVE